MNIFYWRSPSGNFGDDLNEWLWDDMLPGWRTWEPERTLLGVGTILSSIHFRDDRKYLLCGSGTGFGRPPDVRDPERWQIGFVRGPKTAALMNIPQELAISDPAIVIPRISRFSCTQRLRGTIFIPHCDSDASPIYDWAKICRDAGVEHVSPRRDSHHVIRAVSSATKVITESMHGAIIADSFRIPWKPVSLVPNFNTFKWIDWAEGLNLQFRITPLPRPIKKRPIAAALSSFPLNLRPQKRAKLRKRQGAIGLDQVATIKTYEAMSAAIRLLAQSDFYLSSDADISRAQERVLHRLLEVARAYR